MADPVRDFLLDANGDLAINSGDFGLASGEVAINQGIAIRLGVVLGEIFLDESLGVDYPGQILIKNPNPIVVRELLKDAIAETPDVTDVIGAQLQLSSDRQASISFQVTTSYSVSTINGSVKVGQ